MEIRCLSPPDSSSRFLNHTVKPIRKFYRKFFFHASLAATNHFFVGLRLLPLS